MLRTHGLADFYFKVCYHKRHYLLRMACIPIPVKLLATTVGGFAIIITTDSDTLFHSYKPITSNQRGLYVKTSHRNGHRGSSLERLTL